MYHQQRALLGAIFVAAAIATPSAQAQTYQLLYSFTQYSPEGSDPGTGVILDATGNLYGTTAETIFKLNTSGVFTLLYTFPATFDPSGLTQDSAGDLYGTTEDGGTALTGSVFELENTGTEVTLYNFKKAYGPKGSFPNAGVIRDSSGNLYGTTISGGVGGLSSTGVVFRLNTAGVEKVLYPFTGGTDGANPYAGLIEHAGYLYGTTAYGGGGACLGGCGVIFKVEIATGTETVLYTFTGGADGAHPYASLFRDAAGTLYGTTAFGGVAPDFSGYGVVFMFSGGTEVPLYAFKGGTDGANPYAGVVRDQAGNLYGTTPWGGNTVFCNSSNVGCGVVYMLNTALQESVLHTFTGGADGGTPAGVILSPAGNLYGTTGLQSGATGGGGTVFEVAP
ncbi:MAG: choice-of-anchor tandem repeat GloVer-containing protein [Bryobacteraceae bacterium]|jgi:uncharacterized repeat protein (TIGR03803 family)